MKSGVLDAIDEVIAAMLRLRSALSEDETAKADTDDLVDTWTASQRFNIPIDSVRWLAREKCFGEKRAGRWLISVRALREHVSRL
jgi:hypothetical protein